jgi:hypothetical protein
VPAVDFVPTHPHLVPALASCSAFFLRDSVASADEKDVLAAARCPPPSSVVPSSGAAQPPTAHPIKLRHVRRSYVVPTGHDCARRHCHRRPLNEEVAKQIANGFDFSQTPSSDSAVFVSEVKLVSMLVGSHFPRELQDLSHINDGGWLLQDPSHS